MHAPYLCEQCGFDKDCCQCVTPGLWYVNAYRVTLGYGGPEEGGWYYSIHEPIASIPVSTEPDETNMIAYLKRHFPNPDNKSSVAPGAHDILIVVEEGVAEYSPTETPRYE